MALNDASASSDSLTTKTINLPDGRTVSYVCIPAPQPTTSEQHAPKAAVVHFGPLSACATATIPWNELWKTLKTSASIITVDRPGCHETSPVPEPNVDNPHDSNEDWVLRRLRVNTDNTLAVLKHEKIHTVYVLAVCLGHAYAIHFARELIQSQNTKIELKDISLVAPFVSTVCPKTWYMARLGNAVPFCVLSTATNAMMCLGSTLTPYVLSPSAVRNMLSDHEQLLWRDPDDYEFTCQMIKKTQPLTESVKSIEACFGSSEVWQQVIDDFAIKAGYGLHLQDGKVQIISEDQNDQRPCLFPRIKIHVSPNDGMVTTKAVECLARRCYADCEVVTHKKMSSHLTMTLLGGPPRNPYLLRDICQNEFGIIAPSGWQSCAWSDDVPLLSDEKCTINQFGDFGIQKQQSTSCSIPLQDFDTKLKYGNWNRSCRKSHPLMPPQSKPYLFVP